MVTIVYHNLEIIGRVNFMLCVWVFLATIFQKVATKVDNPNCDESLTKQEWALLASHFPFSIDLKPLFFPVNMCCLYEQK